MSGGRVLVDSGSVPLATARELLAGTGVTVEPCEGGWSGDDVAAVITWERPLGERELERLPALRVVATPSVGYDHIDVAAATRRGVHVCHVPDYCIDEMADSALALLLALLRGVVVLDRSVRAGVWDHTAAGPLRRLDRTRLGVIGFGRIGRALAARAAALGMEVWAADPVVPADAIAATGARPASLDELLAACGAVSLHVPLTPETDGLLGERELRRLPRGAVLVNTARAALVDQEALLRALEDGHLAAAALDVLPVEPPTPDAPVPQSPRLVVTPHAAWYSEEAEEAVYRRAVLAVREALEGRTPVDRVPEPEPVR